jgi:hypothetical protein
MGPTSDGAVVEPPFDGSAPRDHEPEFLVLDIGGDVGALVLYADDTYLGAEIDLTPTGMPRNHHVHTVIRRRQAPAGELVAGVYPELPAGVYTVWGLEGQALGDITIAGGRVTEKHVRELSCRA